MSENIARIDLVTKQPSLKNLTSAEGKGSGKEDPMSVMHV